MKKFFGTILMILGAALLASAFLLFFMNQQEANRAAQSAQLLMDSVYEEISPRLEKPEDPTFTPFPTPQREPGDTKMDTVEVGGFHYIGFLSIPALELDLPVMSSWSDNQLTIAPCRYTGSIFSDDLVIMAHNYDKHFGHLKDLKPEEIIQFTDVMGYTVRYQLITTEILEPQEVEEMTKSDYDLTLFTCTYGGKQRVTLRFNRLSSLSIH